MSNTYGYSSLVGEWAGSFPLDESERSPVAALRSILGRLPPILDQLHRPVRLRISWAEFDEHGTELAFHELEEYAITSWPEIDQQLDRLRSTATGRFAVSAVFIDLDTRIIEDGVPVWKADAGTLLLSIEQPELTPVAIQVVYSTFIDAWLTTTYDEMRHARDNRTIAIANRPSLEAVLIGLRALVGPSYRVESSQTYPFAITENGFAEVDELP